MFKERPFLVAFAVALLVGAIALTGSASAATLSTSGGALTLYEDMAGVDDWVHFYDDGPFTLFFPQPYGSAAALDIRPACSSLSGGAMCPVTSVVQLALDGGNDKVEGGTRGSVRLDFQGGDGNDSFRGYTVSGATFSGGDGNDSLIVTSDSGSTGAAGADVINGDAGDDEIGTLHGGDLVSGGAGIDTVVADTASAISLDGQQNDAPIGDAAIGNVAPDVENIKGSSGADRLIGSADPNSIDAWDGDDYVEGSGGGDVLLAGAGDDVIQARDGVSDNISCGPGRDIVDADLEDVVSPDCETVRRPDVTPPRATVKVGKQSLSTALRKGIAARGSSSEPSTLRLDVLISGTLAKRLGLSTRSRATVIATSGTKPLAASGSLRLNAKLGSRAKRALRRRPRTIKIVARVTATDAAGNSASAKQTSRLIAPARR